MWQSKILLSENFFKHRQFLENKLSKIPKLSFVTKVDDNRMTIFLAAENYDERDVKKKVNDAIISLILIKIKHEYILKNISVETVDSVTAAYLACIMSFRAPHERKILENVLFTQDIYSLDGILNFKMDKIMARWEELCVFSDGLLNSDMEDEDFYNLIIFFLSTSGRGEQSLFITAGGGSEIVTNLTAGGVVAVEDLYPERELNLIAAVLYESPTEILTEESFSGTPLIKFLNKIVKVRVI